MKTLSIYLMVVKFRDWELEVDRATTLQTYNGVLRGGSDRCICSDCKNYIAYRDKIFSEEIKQLFIGLGIDYRKEVEIMSIQKLDNGLHAICGWFHFQGKVVKGKDYRIPINGNNGYSVELTNITDNFSIGFAEGDALTFFENKNDLVQIEFMANIPWVIDKELETR